jgi:hypothetical protein
MAEAPTLTFNVEADPLRERRYIWTIRKGLQIHFDRHNHLRPGAKPGKTHSMPCRDLQRIIGTRNDQISQTPARLQTGPLPAAHSLYGACPPGRAELFAVLLLLAAAQQKD